VSGGIGVVHKGDSLVWLDLERIDQAIRDLEAERQLADLTLKLAQEELFYLVNGRRSSRKSAQVGIEHER
jgi:hypothetical protein